ncbi:MAG: hypothetical protein ABI968_14675, partial [Acidobacteriota bacterium]
MKALSFRPRFRQALAITTCVLTAIQMLPANSQAISLGGIKRSFTGLVPVAIPSLPKGIKDAIKNVNGVLASVDATVTSAKYQFDQARLTKERALSLGSDLSKLVHGDWNSILGDMATNGALANASIAEVPALVIHDALESETLAQVPGQGDAMEGAVKRWLQAHGAGEGSQALVVMRRRGETAPSFRARVGKAQADLDRTLSSVDDLGRVITISGLPVTLGRASGDCLPATLKLGLMSLTPNGLYGFDFEGLASAQCTHFVSAGQGLTFGVCGNGPTRRTLDRLAKKPDSDMLLGAEVDVTIASMAQMMP